MAAKPCAKSACEAKSPATARTSAPVATTDPLFEVNERSCRPTSCSLHTIPYDIVVGGMSCAIHAPAVLRNTGHQSHILDGAPSFVLSAVPDQALSEADHSMQEPYKTLGRNTNYQCIRVIIYLPASTLPLCIEFSSVRAVLHERYDEELSARLGPDANRVAEERRCTF